MAAEVPVEDPTSQSNYTKIATTNVALDWTIDFEKRYIYGSATHQLIAKEDVSEVVYVDHVAVLMTGLTSAVDSFDTHTLDIGSVEVNGNAVKVHSHLVIRRSISTSLVSGRFVYDQLRRDWIPSIQSWDLLSISPSHSLVQKKLCQ